MTEYACLDWVQLCQVCLTDSQCRNNISSKRQTSTVLHYKFGTVCQLRKTGISKDILIRLTKG